MIDPIELSRLLKQKFPPTPQQAAVIGAELEPMLVVAGAGAGKTETMAARVVWLVANNIANPDRILGLTFTRKAAQQLSQRIRGRLEQLAGMDALRDIDPSGELSYKLEAIAPTVSTYDSYAGSLIREYGLLLPVEPTSRLITETELFQIAYDIVINYSGSLDTQTQPVNATEKLLSLVSEIDNHIVSPQDIVEETDAFLSVLDDVEAASKRGLNQILIGWKQRQIIRKQMLPMVAMLKQHLAYNNLMTFGEQMSLAARLAEENPQVGASQRDRYSVVLLDEYQDTGHAQRVLLRSLFSGAAVTAVGDPMQSIYGWRGATSANLERFREDFALGEEPAQKRELTVSFRNPPEVLQLANEVSREVLGAPDNPRRTVQPLSSREGAPHGEVTLGFFPSAEKEREFVADQLAEAYKNRGESFTAAVLVRKKRHSAPIALELQSRGVPVEIVGLSGLIDIPEVADLIAIAAMLIRPQDTKSALRILAGPHVGLGAADILALADRAANLAGRGKAEREEKKTDPLERLEQIIAETLPKAPESVVGLAEAVADLDVPREEGAATRYSDEGLRRLQLLASELRYLRTHSLGHSLPDLFADIERVFGIRTEVLQREDPHSDGAPGTVHLDRFAEVVSDFARVPNATLSQFLDYLELSRSQGDGLEPGEVQVRSDRVQILTVHKAKGLEWQIVSVMHADSSTYKTTTSTWLSNESAVPSALRGDAREDDSLVGAPVWYIDSAESPADLKKQGEAHIAEFRAVEEEENARLFYVALTRAEERVLVTASTDITKASPPGPYAHLDMLRTKFPDCVVEWFDGESDDALEPPLPEIGVFPQELRPEGADAVKAAMVDLPELIEDGELFERWEQEVTALIEEHHQLSTPVVPVELGLELTASDIVNLSQDPQAFARRRRRPVPFKPNSYAKRGTAFHQWLENRFGATALLDADELPGIDDALDGTELETLKARFLDSEWADRTPEYVEHPFEVSIGEHIVRGRMDAVFRDADGRWIVVDWKTGQPPTEAAERRSVSLQLAVYRLAWARLQGVDPSEVQALFHYVGRNFSYRPSELPDEASLARMLALNV
ncbi:ATP-dependent helicase [Corynebacterium pseudotuberculosis]|uniref:ATP-dependent helicase n=1 Tax=Corynebacterium pseudotuberculosis TaxID=1719 RepID=UPI0001DD4B55|nr:UvrD-helicase domain-containing protein [Corynebacterium pseudotuberculosis]ADL20436.1 ATP-dependent helicase [Corynebacterium pseudotuberculosis 1002]AEX39019.1 DNA helicase, UvrD/REP type [Corynebacterium pseudotuberculosis 3/99-5]AIG06921.1 ATP-dependent DNA helicase [Corynebacterium pseudotuberculosis]AIG08497.1 ATP-dependent DNA helicase [Corynebacterium pseudotuberculosis]AIG10389.1 ATP-dependent DNA helicase [Corynebacterium pseudotuberculosis]